LVGRYDKDGLPGDDCALDGGEGWEMEVAGRGNWIKALSGPHSGENLGWYTVRLLDQVGIMSKKGSKASPDHIQYLYNLINFFVLSCTPPP